MNKTPHRMTKKDVENSALVDLGSLLLPATTVAVFFTGFTGCVIVIIGTVVYQLIWHRILSHVLWDGDGVDWDRYDRGELLGGIIWIILFVLTMILL